MALGNFKKRIKFRSVARILRRPAMYSASASALVVVTLVLTGMLPLDSPDPLGSLSDNLSTKMEEIQTRIVGPRSFDAPAPALAQPAAPPPAPPVALPTAVPAQNTPAPAPSLTPDAPSNVKNASPEMAAVREPVYSAYDFLTGYLANVTYPILLDAKPWDNGSVNWKQYAQPGGGTTYWDYFIEDESWTSPNHMWRDDQGNWHTYSKETITDVPGKPVTAYILVDRNGPGVMDKLWFTHDAVAALFGLFNQPDPPEVKDWGNLEKIGNLRIEVDGKRVYDGPIQPWFSGDAQHLPSDLKDLFVWRYGQFGAEGNIIPIPYQKHIKISTYGGTGKPKWFMATGLSLPPDTRVQSYTGSPDDLQLSSIEAYARNVYNPETYIDQLDNIQDYTFNITSTSPAVLSVQGSGTITALQFQIPKKSDLSHLSFRVQYGDTVGISVPLLAFFSDPDVLSLHHSSPIGVVESGDSLLFYSNLPMPFQKGMVIELTSDDSVPIPLKARFATSNQLYGTQLRVNYTPNTKLTAYGPDFQVNLDGAGKMVGLVLSTKDQLYDKVPRPPAGQDDAGHRVWPMGYLEGNLTISDGAGNARYYSGQEDWAEGGYYFNDGFTIPPGGSNRPFAGVMRYHQGGNTGFATLFRYFDDISSFPFKDGLHLSFGHGTWQNNYPVTYSTVVFYYLQVPDVPPITLPATNYITVTPPQQDVAKP